MEEPEVKYAKYMQGLIAAYGGVGINIDALLACIHDEDQALLVLDAAYQIVQEAIHAKSTQEKNW